MEKYVDDMLRVIIVASRSLPLVDNYFKSTKMTVKSNGVANVQ